jgi:hypothetical protein
VLCFVAHAQVSNDEVQKFIEANRPNGFGPGQIIARADGDITYDGRPDTVILYSYQIGESQDRSHAEYLVVFKSGERYEPIRPRLVGNSGAQYLNELSIDGVTITLRGMGYAPKDPLCCPSEAIVIQYVVVDRELVAKGQKRKPTS